MNRCYKAIHLYAQLLQANLRSHIADPWKALMLAVFMFVQNGLFFLLWVVFFRAIGSIKGWGLEDIGILFGLLGSSIGLTLFLFDGIRSLPGRIADGSFDACLTRPVSPLPLLLFSRSSPASLGDIITGPFYWIFVGHVGLGDFILLTVLAMMGAVIFASSAIAMFSITFWLRKGGRLAEQLLEMMIIFTAAQPQAQSTITKIIMFSIMPAGFIGYIPVLMVRDPQIWHLAAMGAGVLVFPLLATSLFERGIAAYKASNG